MASHFAKPMAERLAYIDEQLAAIFAGGEQYSQPHDLNPLPILGMPGWHTDNDVEAFYDNQNYFRAGRRVKHEKKTTN